MVVLAQLLEFEWDSGNQGKNFRKHRVTDEECEETFFDEGKKMLTDTLHSQNESRHILLGKTKNHRVLFVVFTLRKQKIRVISARDFNTREQHLYEKETKS